MTETILVRDFCPSNGHFLHIQRPQDITTRKKVIDFVQEYLTQECFNFLLEQNLQVLRFGGPNFQLDFKVYPWSAVKNFQRLLHFKIIAYPDEEIATFHYVCPDQLRVCKNNPFLKNGPTPASFPFIFCLFKQTLQIFTTNVCEKMSIQYTAPGFEPTTLGM